MPDRIINVDTVQTRERTMKLGLTWNDKDENIRSGFVVYSSCYPEDKNHNYVRVLDMDGNQVHQWDMGDKMPGLWSYMPEPQCVSRYVKPGQKGLLLAITKIPSDSVKKQQFVAWNADRGGLMELIDFDGNVIWSYSDEHQNHDARLTKEGNLIYIASEVLDNEKIAKKVVKIAAKHRGFSQTPRNPKVYSDVVKVVDPVSSEVLYEWHASEHLDPNIDMINYNDTFDEWNHGNTVFPLYEDPNNRNKLTDILISFRQNSMIGKINIATGMFQRLITSPFISQQHDSTSLDESNTNRILVFNNRYCPNDYAPSPFSRVIEYDLTRCAPCIYLPEVTGPKVAWEYQDGTLDLYSGYIGGAQRLPGYTLEEHGVHYTLITEGMKGRMFIVKTTIGTSDGEKVFENKVVWEFMNPEIAPGQRVEDLVLRRTSVLRSRYVLPDLFSAEQLERMSSCRNSMFRSRM